MSDVTSVPQIMGHAPYAAVATPESETELNHPLEVRKVRGLSTGHRTRD
jgi:hypothetical protein